jgi:D-hydroxyproline dehydrogenase subunit alpha
VTARHTRALVVVGGGVAGLAAAVEARRAGVPTCVVDSRPALRAPSELLAAFESSGAETWLETTAWGIWGHDLALCGPRNQSTVLAFDQLIVATGAFERPVAFPGWTLPGVMTLGEAERLLDQGAVLGQRVLLAGYGRPVAAASVELRERAVKLVGALSASATTGQVPVRAEGNGRLERIVVADVDADWYPRAGTEKVVDVDALVLAFGSLPEDRLARLVGCEHSGSAYLNPTTVRDDWMRTSVPGVLVAGDAGGVLGPDIAIDQGRLAGLTAAIDAGCLSLSEGELRGQPIRERLAVAEAAADRAPRAGLYMLADPTTVICRCESVTEQALAEQLFAGTLDPGSVIAETRAGMGECQARGCASLIAATVARHAGVPLARMPPITPRPPVFPVPLGALAERPPQFA